MVRAADTKGSGTRAEYNPQVAGSNPASSTRCFECYDWGEWYDGWGMCPCFVCFPQHHVVYQMRRLTR